MGVDVPVALFLCAHALKNAKQDNVFENVGCVAGVEGVSIGEHRGVLVWDPEL
jgi:hypothetical protein